MSRILARFLTDDVLIKPLTGTSEQGTPTYGTPRTIKGCYKQDNEQQRDARSGAMFMPTVAVWSYDTALKYGDLVGNYGQVRRIVTATERRGPQSVLVYAG